MSVLFLTVSTRAFQWAAPVPWRMPVRMFEKKMLALGLEERDRAVGTVDGVQLVGRWRAWLVRRQGRRDEPSDRGRYAIDNGHQMPN